MGELGLHGEEVGDLHEKLTMAAIKVTEHILASGEKLSEKRGGKAHHPFLDMLEKEEVLLRLQVIAEESLQCSILQSSEASRTSSTRTEAQRVWARVQLL